MTLRLLRSTLVLFLVLVFAPPAAAQTSHYVAPPGWQGAGTGDGTQANPWRSIGDALKAAGPGDTLLLMDGSYGGFFWNTQTAGTLESPVTIQSLNGRGAHFDWIEVVWQGHGLKFRNVSVWPTAGGPARRTGDLVHSANPLALEGLDIRGRADAPDTMFGWTAEEWSSLPTGVNFRGADSSLIDSTISGVNFGIVTDGRFADNVDLIGNTINGFVGDAIRPLGDNTRVIGNRITNAIDIQNGNHDDGIQSFVTKNGVQAGLLIEGNTIIGWTEEKSHPLRSASFQGIGLFDGPYGDLVIRNNIVAITHIHGIAIAGSINSLVSHNTVVDLQPGFKWSPRISSDRDRSGNPPTNAVVANNLAMALASSADPGVVTFTGNSIISSPGAVFEDPAAYDYRPRADSGFIDTADPAHAAARDVFGNARPQGNGPDRGAIELGGAPAQEEPAPEEPAQPEQPPAEEGDTGSGGTPDGGSTGDGGGDTGGTDGGTEPAPSPGPKFEKPPKKDNPNKGKGADKQALKAEKAARREARRAARAAARAAAPVVSTRSPVLSGISRELVSF